MVLVVFIAGISSSSSADILNASLKGN